MSAPVYQWQPSSAEIARRAGLDPSAVIRFDHNTSPRPPTWATAPAMLPLARLNEYPAADYADLRAAAAAYTGTSPAQVVTGAGADELIELCAKAFLPPAGRAISAPPTYALYAVATAQRGATLEESDRTEPDFALPASFFQAAASVDLVWLCVPNNPTGHRDGDDQLHQIISTTAGVVVIDAAYAEFCGDRWAGWVDRYPNLVVLGTLSKAFSLAGIRVGYSISHPDLAARLDSCRPPGSVSTLSAAIATEALTQPERAMSTVADITRRRAELAAGLARLGLTVLPSLTNFLLTRWGADAREVAERLMWEQGLVVRAFRPGGPLADYLRFTVRSLEENHRLLTALERSRV